MLIEHTEILSLNIQGIPFQILIPDYSEDAQTFRRLHLERPNYEYEAVMTALLTRLLQSLPEEPCFLDIGAFIGYFSLYTAKLLPTIPVYAIESNPRHVKVLEQAKALNQLDNLKIISAVLSDRAEKLAIVENAVLLKTEDQDVIRESQTLDQLCQQLQLSPQIAKMDVHGFEGKILGGMTQTLRNSLQFLLLELHPNVYLEKYTPGITRMQILDLLEAAGFTLYYVAGHRYSWSDGLRQFFETGRFAYQPLTRETRGMLLFDRHGYVLVLASKAPLEPLLGRSILDPSLE